MPVRVGYLISDTGIQKAYEQNVSYSAAGSKDHLEKMDVFQRSLDWKPFKITDNDPATFINPGVKCKEWIQEESVFSNLHGRTPAGKDLSRPVKDNKRTAAEELGY